MNGESSAPDLVDLVTHVAATSGLPAGMARRIVGDMVAYHGEPVEAYVVRRHRELAEQGTKNETIYRQLQEEVAERLFPGPRCSPRQIRRMIYG